MQLVLALDGRFEGDFGVLRRRHVIQRARNLTLVATNVELHLLLVRQHDLDVLRQARVAHLTQVAAFRHFSTKH